MRSFLVFLYSVLCFEVFFNFVFPGFVTVFANFTNISPAIHQVLFNTLTRGSEELLDVVTECLTKFAADSSTVGRATVVDYLAATKTNLAEPAAFTRDLTDRLVRLQTVYPDLFDEDFATLTFKALHINLDVARVEQSEIPHVCDGVKKCALMITLVSRTTKDPQKFVPDLLELILHTEETLMTRNGRQLTGALSGFLRGHAALVVDLFFRDSRILQPKWTAFLEKLLRGKDDLKDELKTQLTTDKLDLLTNLIMWVRRIDFEGLRESMNKVKLLLQKSRRNTSEIPLRYVQKVKEIQRIGNFFFFSLEWH